MIDGVFGLYYSDKDISTKRARFSTDTLFQSELSISCCVNLPRGQRISGGAIHATSCGAICTMVCTSEFIYVKIQNVIYAVEQKYFSHLSGAFKPRLIMRNSHVDPAEVCPVFCSVTSSFKHAILYLDLSGSGHPSRRWGSAFTRCALGNFQTQAQQRYIFRVVCTSSD